MFIKKSRLDNQGVFTLKVKNILIFFSLLTVASVTCLPQNLAEAQSLDNVQITIQTSGLGANYFIVNAYNMTGSLEAATQTHYSGASFELPDGQYIFTVTATNQSYSTPLPLLTSSSGSGSASISSSLPIYIAPASEYGYSVQQVSGSVILTILTQNVTQFPTNQIQVKVSYANETAVEDSYVSASVIGANYYWGYEPKVVTWATTGTDGIADLVTPVAPIQIDCWKWVPSSSTSYPAPQTSGSGQTVNGTIVAAPIYSGLAGSTIIIPPQTSAHITLLPQQAEYWITPALTAPSGGSSNPAPGPGSIPFSVYSQQQGNPNLPNNPIPEFSFPLFGLLTLGTSAAAIIFGFIKFRKPAKKLLITPQNLP
jgi:hypothetical protein